MSGGSTHVVVAVEDYEKGCGSRRQKQHATVHEAIRGQKSSADFIADQVLLFGVIAITATNYGQDTGLST